MFPESGTLKNNEITIQLSLDGFSYVVYDRKNRRFVHLERVGTENPSLKHAVSEIESAHSCSVSDFSRCIVLFDNCANTFVPTSIFQNQTKDKHLDFLGVDKGERIVMTDMLDIIEAQNVFSITKEDADTLAEMQENVTFHHASSVMVTSLMKDNLHRINDTIIHINVKSPKFDMIVTRGSNLLFHNVFSFKTKEDFIYFVLFTIDQLHIDAGTAPFYFLGMIEEKSQLVELTSRYIRDIRFVRHNNDMVFDGNVEETPYYKNYQLFNSITCEL